MISLWNKVALSLVLLAPVIAGIGLSSARAATGSSVIQPVVWTLKGPVLQNGRVKAAAYYKTGGVRRVANLSYTYAEADFYGNACGGAISGRGGLITLKYPGVGSVKFNFKAVAKIKGRPVQRSWPAVTLGINSRVMACGRRHAYDVLPDSHNVCLYQFSIRQTTNACGVPRRNETAITPYGPSDMVAYWTAQPYMDLATHTIYPPPFVTPSGLCEKQNLSNTVVPWLNNNMVSTKYVCADGTKLYMIWYVYLAPDAKSGPGVQPDPTCRAGDFPGAPLISTGALPFGGSIDHLTIPGDWHGRLSVEIDLETQGTNGDITAFEYTDASFWNDKGTVNGCDALTSLHG